MKKRIRVLYVEDSAKDVELETWHLREAGFEIEQVRVDHEEALEQSLQDFVPDIVISDSSMPRLTCLQAVRIVRKASPTLPFILVSGTILPEVVAQVMEEGATGHASKEDLVEFTRIVTLTLGDVDGSGNTP